MIEVLLILGGIGMLPSIQEPFLNQISDVDLSHRAYLCYCDGIAAIEKPSLARSLLSQAVELWEFLWQKGYHSPELAFQLGTSYLNMSEMAKAICAFRRGLLESPADEQLQKAVRFAQNQISFPDEFRNAIFNKPKRLFELISPKNAWLTWGVLWSFTWFCLVRYRLKRYRYWYILSFLMVSVSIVTAVYLFLKADQLRNELRLPLGVIVSENTILRMGNNSLFPERSPGKLPAGLEAKVLFQRGDWIQIGFAKVTGWVEKKDVLMIAGESLIRSYQESSHTDR